MWQTLEVGLVVADSTRLVLRGPVGGRHRRVRHEHTGLLVAALVRGASPAAAPKHGSPSSRASCTRSAAACSSRCRSLVRDAPRHADDRDQEHGGHRRQDVGAAGPVAQPRGVAGRILDQDLGQVGQRDAQREQAQLERPPRLLLDQVARQHDHRPVPEVERVRRVADDLHWPRGHRAEGAHASRGLPATITTTVPATGSSAIHPGNGDAPVKRNAATTIATIPTHANAARSCGRSRQPGGERGIGDGQQPAGGQLPGVGRRGEVRVRLQVVGGARSSTTRLATNTAARSPR